MNKAKSLCCWLGIMVLLCVSALASPLPKFSDFPSGTVHVGPSIRPILTNPAARAFKARIFEGATARPNYNGHYHLIRWGCGTSCSEGAIVDALTGHVTMLPFSICCYAGSMANDFDAIEARPSSSLVIFHGQRDEQGINGDHYYFFDGHTLSFLQSVETKEFIKQAASPEVSDVPRLDVGGACASRDGCRGLGRDTPACANLSDEQRTYRDRLFKRCVDDEQRAYDTIKDHWSDVDQDVKANCSAPSRIAPYEPYQGMEICINQIMNQRMRQREQDQSDDAKTGKFHY